MKSPYSPHARRCSPGQIHQLSRLTVQLGLMTIRDRNAWLERQLGHPVEHLIDLTEAEARACADVLKVEVLEREKDRNRAL